MGCGGVAGLQGGHCCPAGAGDAAGHPGAGTRAVRCVCHVQQQSDLDRPNHVGLGISLTVAIPKAVAADDRVASDPGPGLGLLDRVGDLWFGIARHRDCISPMGHRLYSRSAVWN